MGRTTATRDRDRVGGGRGLGKGGQVGALRQPNVVLHDSWGFLLLGVRVLHEGVGVPAPG